MSKPRDPRLTEIWEQLELPPPAAVPQGFATRVVAQCRSRAADALPGWVHAAAVLSLVLGLGLGLGISPELEPATQPSAMPSAQAPPPADVGSMPTLSELYWSREEFVDRILEEDGGEL